jgi:prenyltransferase beta subunit
MLDNSVRIEKVLKMVEDLKDIEGNLRSINVEKIDDDEMILIVAILDIIASIDLPDVHILSENIIGEA